MQVFIGLDYGDTAKGELHVGKFPGGRRGVGDEIFYRFCIGFCIDFLLISSMFNRFFLPRAIKARAPQTW